MAEAAQRVPLVQVDAMKEAQALGSIARLLSLQKEHGTTEKPVERNGPCLLKQSVRSAAGHCMKQSWQRGGQGW